MKRLEFHISYTCTNNCSFCSESERMKEFNKKPVSLREIKKVLTQKRKEGFDFVNLTGGEPTIHPDFLEIIRFAKKIGYKIYVGTNGTMLARFDFCKKAVPYLDEISLSIHGHNAGVHDSLVGRRGAFDGIRSSINNLDQLEFSNRLANVVATRKNFGYLEDILDFLSRNKFKQVLFSNVAPEGDGLNNFTDLEVRMSDWRRKAGKLKKISGTADVPIRFFGLPICALGDAKLLSNDMYWDGRATVERGVSEKNDVMLSEIKDLHPIRNRVKTDTCKKCIYDNLCYGVFAEYVKNFGSKELKPFKDGK